MAIQVFTQNQINQNLEDKGTNAPVVTTQQSQSVSYQTAPGPKPYIPASAGAQKFDDGSSIQTFDDGSTIVTDSAGKTSATNAIATAASKPGIAAAKDDNFGGLNTASGTSVILNASTQPGSLISPQTNVLDQFASYTYNIGWYLLTPTQFSSITNSTKLDVNQWSLLAQSGGAGAEQTAVSQTGISVLVTTGRNKYFVNDYYIDDLEITSTLGGGGPATLTEISFKVYEPNGLTLLPNLTSAVRDLYQQLAAANNLAFYCLVIKFYGWDVEGNLISSPIQNKGMPGITPSISNAAVTRYYPFQIKEFNFKVASRGVEYHIIGGPQHFQYASSSGTASVPYNIELTGQTVGQVLSGSGSTVGTPVSDGREATVQAAPATKQQAAIAAGTDPNAITDQGMAFGGGGL